MSDEVEPVTAIKSLIEKIYTAGNAALDSHSPSLAFAELGKRQPTIAQRLLSAWRSLWRTS